MPSVEFLRSSVRSLLTNHGYSITVVRTSPPTYDPATGVATPAPATQFPGIGRFGSYADRLIDGERIRTGDRRVSFLPDDFAFRPLIGDTIAYPVSGNSAGDAWMVISAIVREDAGSLICVTMQVRGSGFNAQ